MINLIKWILKKQTNLVKIKPLNLDTLIIVIKILEKTTIRYSREPPLEHIFHTISYLSKLQPQQTTTYLPKLLPTTSSEIRVLFPVWLNIASTTSKSGWKYLLQPKTSTYNFCRSLSLCENILHNYNLLPTSPTNSPYQLTISTIYIFYDNFYKKCTEVPVLLKISSTTSVDNLFYNKKQKVNIQQHKKAGYKKDYKKRVFKF